MMRFALAAVAALALMPAPPAQAQVAAPAPAAAPAQPSPAAPPPPVLTTVATYQGGGGQVTVGAFLDSDQRVGVIGVSSVRRASIALAKDEWATLIDLWQQARAVKAATWQPVGTFKETGLKEPSVLTVMGGPGVQFTITDPRGAFTVSVPKSDFTRFDASLHKVELFLDGGAIEPDRPAALVRHHARRHRPTAAAAPKPAAPAAPATRCTGAFC